MNSDRVMIEREMLHTVISQTNADAHTPHDPVVGFGPYRVDSAKGAMGNASVVVTADQSSDQSKGALSSRLRFPLELNHVEVTDQ